MPGYEVGYEVLPSGILVLWCAARGDWEMPVAFCLYIGEDSEIHAYIPRDGNAGSNPARDTRLLIDHVVWRIGYSDGFLIRCL